VQARAGAAVAHDDGAAVLDVAAGDAVVVRDAGGEVVGTVAVEVAGGEGEREEVAALRRVEAEQVVVAEAPRAHGGEADGARLRAGPGGDGRAQQCGDEGDGEAAANGGRSKLAHGVGS